MDGGRSRSDGDDAFSFHFSVFQSNFGSVFNIVFSCLVRLQSSPSLPLVSFSFGFFPFVSKVYGSCEPFCLIWFVQFWCCFCLVCLIMSFSGCVIEVSIVAFVAP